ncbi:MAG: hypothetical protein WBM83_01085 [Flavobacteriaceae bacterium]
MINLKAHSITAFLYFLLAALIGVVLRSFVVFDIPITYKFFVHSHSHIALLGWVYLALTTLLYKLFVQNNINDKRYIRIFWFTQFTLVGMLLTFPFTGYAVFSIIFSTLFLFASYWFFWFFRKHIKRDFKKSNSYKCVKVALWYLVLSSLGPWALGAIMNTLGAESIWYRMAIYFYLHFLYNGWMIMALVGIFFYIMEQQQFILPNRTFKRFIGYINLGIILSFFLSTLFASPPMFLNVLGGVGAVLQLIAFAILWKAFTVQKEKSSSLFSPFQDGLLKTVAVLLLVKMVLQVVTAFPYFANLASTHLDFTIGYLHWTFLGVVSIGLFLFLDFFGLLRIPKIVYYLYLIGFVITETLIFYKGIATWQNFKLFDGYFEMLAGGSFLIPIALILLLVTNLRPKV